MSKQRIDRTEGAVIEPSHGYPDDSDAKQSEGRPHPEKDEKKHGEGRQRGTLRDVRGGTYDMGSAKNFELPEGLRRQRMGPYDRDVGRAFPPKKK